jgi:hypothetical protein
MPVPFLDDLDRSQEHTPDVSPHHRFDFPTGLDYTEIRRDNWSPVLHLGGVG